jgi:hypothetical protein
MTLLPPERRAGAVVCSTSAEAWQRAHAEALPGDLICVTGSVFLAGELRPLLTANLPLPNVDRCS